MALDPSYTPDPEDETKPADIGVAFGYAFKEIRFLKNYLKDKFTNVINPHVAATENPHSVTKAQVGLPNIPDWDASTDPALGNSDTTLVSQNAVLLAIENTLKNKIYPIGAYYITESNVDPATTMGFGTWQLLEAGRGLVSREAVDNLSEYFNVGTEGGANTKTITANNLPAHSHPIDDPGHSHLYDRARSSFINDDIDAGSTQSIAYTSTATTSATTGITVQNNITTNTPLDVRNKYRVANIWRRVA